jgi:hypothetical protein
MVMEDRPPRKKPRRGNYMSRILRRRPSPGTVIAFLALFVAMSGVSYGLAGTNTVFSNDIVRNAVGRSEIRTNAVRSAEIRRNAVGRSEIRTDAVTPSEVRDDTDNGGGLTGLQINEGTLGEVPSATNADTVGGQTPAQLDQPRAFARVELAGNVDEPNTSGVTDAQVTLQGTVYCFNLAFNPRQVQATVDWLGGGGDAVIHASVNDSASCPGAESASARIVDASAGTAVTRNFYITFVD